MSIDERARHELHLAVERALGVNEAATLMALLPPVGWADIATKADFEAQRAVITAEIEGLRAELRGEMSELRGGQVGLRGELQASFEARLTEQTRTILLAVIALMVTTWSAMAGLTFLR